LSIFMQNGRGKFIVFYGINNLGKTTQAKILVDKLKLHGLKAEYLKYPVYDIAPSGPILNNYLRQHNFYNLTPREAQIIYAFNRLQFEETLKQKLARSINVVAEDYCGTGIAWGATKGAPLEALEQINQGLLIEDIAILLDGERFMEGKESDHLHERDDELMSRCRQTHQMLAKRYGWHVIPANLAIESVQQLIWQFVSGILDN